MRLAVRRGRAMTVASRDVPAAARRARPPSTPTTASPLQEKRYGIWQPLTWRAVRAAGARLRPRPGRPRGRPRRRGRRARRQPAGVADHRAGRAVARRRSRRDLSRRASARRSCTSSPTARCGSWWPRTRSRSTSSSSSRTGCPNRRDGRLLRPARAERLRAAVPARVHRRRGQRPRSAGEAHPAGSTSRSPPAGPATRASSAPPRARPAAQAGYARRTPTCSRWPSPAEVDPIGPDDRYL